MLFNSTEYLLFFLPLVLGGYFLTAKHAGEAVSRFFLILASLVFYAWWNPADLPLLLGSMALNYAVGKYLGSRPWKSGAVLTFGVVSNLALLAHYKYTGFFITNFAAFLDIQWSPHTVALPLAISFFTFTQIAYLVDCYRGKVRETDPINYALFVTFFPHLIAGPVVHHRDIMPQFSRTGVGRPNGNNLACGLLLLGIGLVKKVLLADTFAIAATAGFDGNHELTLVEAWLTSLSYTFQIYFDFSGYCDMALGASLMFNIRLPINFNSPYQARNIREFWRSWHITLSTFLRDYLYVPLGGSRHGRGREYANLLATFVLGGLWHGASWMFVIWGLLHGLAIVVHRLWRTTRIALPGWLAWAITFLFVNLAWVFFRAKDWSSSLRVLKGMSGLNGTALPAPITHSVDVVLNAPLTITTFTEQIGGALLAPVLVLATLVAVLNIRNRNELAFGSTATLPRSVPLAVFATAIGLATSLALLKVWSSAYSEFIYFNF